MTPQALTVAELFRQAFAQLDELAPVDRDEIIAAIVAALRQRRHDELAGTLSEVKS